MISILCKGISPLKHRCNMGGCGMIVVVIDLMLMTPSRDGILYASTFSRDSVTNYSSVSISANVGN